MARANVLFGFGLLLFAANCGAPESCVGNCEQICAGKMLETNQCAAEYTRGFNKGFCAGVLNVDRRGDAPNGSYVAGYWDGYSEGSFLRLDWFQEKCIGDRSKGGALGRT
ncbi:MAG: hypothetical protein AAFP81_08765 [Pseudomonadota bacterium]